MSEAELATLGTCNTVTSTSSFAVDHDTSDADDAAQSRVVVSDCDSPELDAQKDSSAFLPALSVGVATSSISQAEAHAERTRVEGPPPESANALHDACQAGDLPRVEELLTPDNINDGALHHAAANNHWRLCELLLARHADVNAKLAPLNATPLMWACRSGHAYIVRLLLDHGADVNVTDASGFTPLHLAVQSSNVLMVAYIVHLEVDVNGVDGGNRTPLHWAVVQSDHISVEVLLKAGASPNLRDGEGTYPLHHAVYTSQSSDIVGLLLQYGADPFATHLDGTRVVTPESAPSAWKHGCENCGRLPSGLLHRSRVLSPELAKCVASVVPFVALSLVLNMTSITGSTWLAVPLGVAVLWCAKYILEQWVVPICWPHPRPMLHSTVLAGTFAGMFTWIVLFYMTQLFSAMILVQPWTTGTIVVCEVLVPFFFLLTLFMDPGIIHPRSTAGRLRSMNDLMDDGLYDSVHFCVHTYVVIPLRACYDYYLERVVCRYDHYCPWVYNAVGIRNHRAFMAFLISLTIGAPLVGKQYIEYSRQHGFTSFGITLFILTSFQLLWISILTAIQIVQTARGTTSYEITHFRNSLVYRTNPLKAFSSLPPDHPKTSEVLGNPSNTRQHDGDSGARHGLHHHHHGHGHHQHGKSKFTLCLKLFGLHQLIVVTRTFLHKASWNKADNGIPRNCADFWCAGGTIWQPDGAQGAVGGIIVNYYTLRDLPSQGDRYLETDEMLV